LLIKQIVLYLDADGLGQEVTEKFRAEYGQKGYDVSTWMPAQGKGISAKAFPDNRTIQAQNKKRRNVHIKRIFTILCTLALVMAGSATAISILQQKQIQRRQAEKPAWHCCFIHIPAKWSSFCYKVIFLHCSEGSCLREK
jgi:hypothetical protein